MSFTNVHPSDADEYTKSPGFKMEPKTLKVRGISRTTSNNTLKLFFASNKKSGGGYVAKINRKDGSPEAIIEFEDSIDALNVTNHGPLRLEEHDLSACLFTPSNQAVGGRGETILVKGLQRSISFDAVELFFEDRNSSGGGDIKKLQYEAGSGEARITFLKPKDAASVVARRVLTLEQVQLTVCWAINEDPDLENSEDEADLSSGYKAFDFQHAKGHVPKETVVLLKGITSSMTEDILPVSLESQPDLEGISVSKVDILPDTESALVTFNNATDAARLVNIGDFTVQGMSLTAQWATDEAVHKRTSDEIVSSNIGITLEVTGLSTAMPDEWYTSLFGNKRRSGGGAIRHYERLDINTAHIVFAEDEDARSVLEKGPFTFKNGISLKVQNKGDSEKEPIPLKSETDIAKIVSIEVSGFSGGSDVNEQTLRLFFENKKSSGGGEIKYFNMYAEEGVAAITFANLKDAEDVLNKSQTGPFQLLGVTLKVRGLEQEIPGESCAIEVRGFDESAEKELISMLFENRFQSGGEEIEDLYFDSNQRRAVITYANPEAPKRVLQKQPLTLNDAVLNVVIMKPARPTPKCITPAAEDKLLVARFDEESSTANLLMFLQRSSSHCKVRRVRFGLTAEQALVEFDGPPDFEAIRQLVNRKPLNGRMLRVQRVPITDTIQIHRIQNIKRDYLILYFETQKQSGGGPLLSKQIFYEKDYALFQFQDPSVIDSVLSQQHTPQGIKLHVSIFYECLGVLPPGHDTSKPLPRKPAPIDIKDMDKDVLAFILASHRNTVEQDLSRVNCEVQWPVSEAETVQLCAVGNLSSDSTKTWAKSAMDVWQNCVKEKYVKTEFETLQHTWDEFTDRAKNLPMAEEDKVKIKSDKAKCSISIWGVTDDVKRVVEKLEKIKTAIEEEMEMAKRQVTEQVTLKPHEVSMLSALKFEETETQRNPDIVIKPLAEGLILTGPPNEITSAKLRLFEIVHNIVSEKVPDIPESVCRLLSKGAIRSHLVKILNSKDVCVEWEAENNHLTVHAMTNCVLKTGLDVIVGEVIETKVGGAAWSSLLKTENFKQLLANSLDKFPDTLEINVSEEDGQIWVASISNQCNLILEDIDDFVGENTIIEETIPIDVGVYDLLQRAYAADIRSIVSDMKSSHVEVNLKTDDDGCWALVSGNKFGLRPVKERVLGIINSMVTGDKDISKPGMNKYFLSKRGEDFIMAEERRHSVSIELVTDEKKKRHEVTRDEQTLSKARLKNGTEIFACLGDLTTYKVDAMVNAANEALYHGGGLARAIVQAGGASIRNECTNYIQSNGKLSPGQVFVSGAGKLPCKKVMHAVGPKWQGGHRGEENIVYEAIFRCLQETAGNNLDSIAIPALGTGIFQVPVAIATAAIVSAVKDFCEKDSAGARIKKVFLVDNQEMTAQQFNKSLQSVLGEKEVQLVDDYLPCQAGITRVLTESPDLTQKAIILYTPVNETTLMTSGGTKVTLCSGNIATQQVDVIVNSTNEKCESTSGVSSAIFKKAGPGLKTEIAAIVPLKSGSVAVTRGHSLPCNSVYHTCCYKWDGPDKKCEKNIRQIISECMAKAAASGFTSIAFPAVGTGNLLVPRAKCAEMLFQEVAINPNKSIKDVRFVVYDKDEETYKAFDAERRRHLAPEAKPKRSRSRILREKRTGFSSGGFHAKETRHGVNPDLIRLSLGSVELQIQLCDITKATTDAIVNSTDKEMDLASGGVARALAKAAGPHFVTECQQAEMTDKIAVTGAGNLKAAKVIHLAAQRDTEQWRQLIAKALARADRMGLRSLTFPALGTGGGGIDQGSMAYAMLGAIGDFSDIGPANVNLVKIAVLPGQPEIFEGFRSEIYVETHGKKTSWWKAKKEAIGEFSGNAKSTASPSRSARGSASCHVRSSPARPVVTKLRVCAQTTAALDAVMKDIDNVVDEECRDKVLDSEDDQENIAKLSASQIREIQKFDQTLQVTIKIELTTTAKTIRVQGSFEDITAVMDHIHAVFMENKRKEHENSRAELVKKQVQWYFEENGGLEAYPGEINALVEQAFSSEKTSVEWDEQDGAKFKIDFRRRVEIQTYPSPAEVKVHRKEKGCCVDVPSHWPRVDPNKDFEVFALTQSDPEYQRVENLFRQSAGKSLNNIKQIERVQNPSLYQKYNVTKDSMIKSNPEGNVENELWHGTSKETLESINRYGFNRSYCGKNAVRLGKGVYFAKGAAYSCRSVYARPDSSSGEKHIYLCKVLTGKYTLGNEGMRVPPERDGTILYDSVVDKVSDPHIFVIFSDTQAYPEYQITFN